MSLESGFILNDKYKVLEKVGRGAFSNCYRAVQLNDDGTENDKAPEVSIKLSTKPEYSFWNEFIVSQDLKIHNRLLRHNDFNTVQLYDKVTEKRQNHEYLVSKFMGNGDLFRFASNEGFDEGWARFLLKQILKGLESLHQDGYAHLDIKLGNILLDHNYLPKIADFGFVHRVPQDSLLVSKDFKYKGTKHYICPEIHAETDFNGQSADIFALGVCFFVLLVGDYPFTNATKTDVKYRNLYKKNPYVFWKKHSRAKKRMNKGLISESFANLITKMITPNSEERLTISEIREHEWFQKPCMWVSKIKDYFEALQHQKKSKSKNPS